MLSPNSIGSGTNAPSIWSLDPGYETNSLREGCHAPSPSLHAQDATGDPHCAQSHAPVIFDQSDFWNAPVTNRNRIREDSVVGPITTQLNVFTTRDSPECKVVCPEVPISSRTPPDTQLKGLKRLRSPTRRSACHVPESAHTSPSSPVHRVKRSRAGRNSKLPAAALSKLQAWLDANKHNPYPTADTKRSLAQACGITEKQVNTWFTNARARQMNPVGSGSEVDITDDSDEADLPQASTTTSAYLHDNAQTGQSRRRLSLASLPRTRPSRRGKKKNYRRNQNSDVPQTPLLLSPASITSPAAQSNATEQEMWQCTFCFKHLVPKSWRRHEDTQHRPKTQAAQWTCMLHGPRLSYPNRTNSGSVCAFCMVKNPTEEHFRQHHRIEECAQRNVADRTFYRPDHLRQHIKNFHNATLFDIVQARWKKAAETVAEGWTCGFCGDRLETWDKRETHVANHFKDGMTMASWREYPDAERKAERESKGKEREIGSAFANAFQPLPIASQALSHGHSLQNVPQCSATAYQEMDASSAAPTGLGLSQPPVLPDIPSMSPLIMNPFSNYLDWSTIPTTFDQQVQYPLPTTNMFEASIPTPDMQQGFGNTLGLELYGNPIDYQGSWEQLQLHFPPQHPSSPHDPQQYDRQQ